MNFTGEKPAPCLHCDQRTMTCHDDCPDYLVYVAGRERIREQRFMEQEINTLMKMPEKECKAFILDAYKECAHQALAAMHGSRAIEKVYLDQFGGKPPQGYLQKYVDAMYATADPDNLDDVIGESGEEQ